MGRGARGDGRYRGQGHSQCACVIIMLSDFLCARKVVSSATFLSFISFAFTFWSVRGSFATVTMAEGESADSRAA